MEKQDRFNIISIFLTKFIFRNNFDTLKKAGFINSYISDPDITDIVASDKKLLFLLFNNKKLKIRDIEDIVKSLAYLKINLIFSYELINNYMMIIIEFPDEYSREYDLIIQGRYSKLSDEFKKAFPETKSVYNSEHIRIGLENTLYYHIFNKTDWIKEFWLKKLDLIELDKGLELWEKPNEEDIIFDKNKMK